MLAGSERFTEQAIQLDMLMRSLLLTCQQDGTNTSPKEPTCIMSEKCCNLPEAGFMYRAAEHSVAVHLPLQVHRASLLKERRGSFALIYDI